MRDPVREFYDQLAGDYHLIYQDWRQAVRRQGAVLDRLIRSFLGPGEHQVLDCACGIGTQAIGLAVRGHHVHASDISEPSVERARVEAESFGATVTFAIADFRDLAGLDRTFDVVMACDNSLPHLTEDADLASAAASMFDRLRPGGLLIASTRDYDKAIEDRLPITQPQRFDDGSGTRIVFQSWDWAPDGRTYMAHLFITRRDGDQWHLSHHQTPYRALRRRELDKTLASSGFVGVTWHAPTESGFYQPIVTARRPA